MSRSTVLVCNDDGIDAPGLHALEKALAEVCDVWTVAPAGEQSARSHALTMHDPLRAERRAPQRWAVAGTPADCAYLALLHLVPVRPDVVVSGINAGSNLGADIWYSGTLAAAREACLHGIPAIAVSQHRPVADDGPHWSAAAAIAVRVMRALLADPLPPWTYLNVNVPDLPLPRILGLRACPLGRRTYAHQVDVREDPRGRKYFWIGGPHAEFHGEGTDGRAVEEGWASVTPLGAYPSDPSALARVRRWTEG